MEPVQLQKRQREEGGETQRGPDSKRLCRGCASELFIPSVPPAWPGQLTQADTGAAGRPEAMQTEPALLGSTPRMCPRCMAGESVKRHLAKHIMRKEHGKAGIAG